MERLERNCWARDEGQEAMASGVEESSVGTVLRNSWSIWEGEWLVRRLVEGSNREAVSRRS